MGDVRLTKAAKVTSLLVLCVMIMVFGIFWEFGIGYAAMIGGFIGSVLLITIPNVDEPKEQK